MKIKNYKILASVALVVILAMVFIMSGSPSVQEPPAPQQPPPGLPIDGGVLLLLASGVIYGIKKQINK
ncbi:PID-CTERM protein-sorting domain-containing protein [Pseudofulvibacter geojedonensis]|uniref:PID-CTERM protein-sorting domain-containing protein n=1 Tax=Pseudofulvibacter geojedonensis TaxID=1123758 RepID=A0ABW3I0J5_9FLAO